MASNSDRYQDLLALRSLPLETKILYANEKIKEAYEHFNGLVYISWSGGKDSRVLLELVKEIYPDVPAIFSDTGLEYPEIRAGALALADISLKPKMTFKECIEKYGYPIHSKRVAQYLHEIQKPTEKNAATVRLRLTGFKPDGRHSTLSMIPKKWQYLKNAPFKISNRCCDVFKKNPFKLYQKTSGRFPFIGTLTGESLDRKYSWLDNGCNVFDSKFPSSRPLSIWTETDILQFHLDRSIPLPSVYGSIIPDRKNGGLTCSGLTRTGCVFCGFGCHLEEKKGLNRFEQLYTSHPTLWSYCMDQLGMADVLGWYGVRIRPGGSQLSLFETAGVL